MAIIVGRDPSGAGGQSSDVAGQAGRVWSDQRATAPAHDGGTMAALSTLYGITDENLALRRQFIGLDEETIATLRDLQPWAEEAADAIAAELTAHHFEFGPTLAFFEAYVAGKSITVDDLRAGWQGAQASHFRAIFAEAAKPRPFGLEYFEGLLRVGALHNTINLPLKWYLGSYPAFLASVRRHLAAPGAPLPGAGDGKPGRGGLLRRRRARAAAGAADVRARAEAAIATVFNYDMQAITDAFYYDTFSNWASTWRRSTSPIRAATSPTRSPRSRRRSSRRSASCSARRAASATLRSRSTTASARRAAPSPRPPRRSTTSQRRPSARPRCSARAAGSSRRRRRRRGARRR
jgi:heam-based aerotactic trancducer